MRRFSGFSLVEVLISLILLSCILLGFDGMEIYSLREIRATYFYHLAINQLYSMSERLRCLEMQDNLASQIAIWNLENKNLLPHGYGKVAGIYPNFTISVFWGKPQSNCQIDHVGQSGCVQCSLKI